MYGSTAGLFSIGVAGIMAVVTTYGIVTNTWIAILSSVLFLFFHMTKAMIALVFIVIWRTLTKFHRFLVNATAWNDI